MAQRIPALSDEVVKLPEGIRPGLYSGTDVGRCYEGYLQTLLFAEALGGQQGPAAGPPIGMMFDTFYAALKTAGLPDISIEALERAQYEIVEAAAGEPLDGLAGFPIEAVLNPEGRLKEYFDRELGRIRGENRAYYAIAMAFSSITPQSSSTPRRWAPIEIAILLYRAMEKELEGQEPPANGPGKLPKGLDLSD